MCDCALGGKVKRFYTERTSNFDPYGDMTHFHSVPHQTDPNRRSFLDSFESTDMGFAFTFLLFL